MNVFVIMPFDSEFEAVYRDLIKDPLENSGYRVSRADDPSENTVFYENIYDQIVLNLWDADYIIADLTGSNPNVTYELGIAHTLNKRTIQISQTLDLMFDIKSQNVIPYIVDGDHRSGLSMKLLSVIERAEKGNYVFSNMVSSFALATTRRIITQPSARK